MGTDVEMVQGLALRFGPVATRRLLDGVQAIFRFPNGYGGSVISHRGSYGVELGVAYWDDPSDPTEDFDLTYDTPVTAGTSGVLGWMTQETLVETLTAIEALPGRYEIEE